MPGPNSRPNGTLREKANVTKRSLKDKARKMRVARIMFDKKTGEVKASEVKQAGKKRA